MVFVGLGRFFGGGEVQQGFEGYEKFDGQERMGYWSGRGIELRKFGGVCFVGREQMVWGMFLDAWVFYNFFVRFFNFVFSLVITFFIDYIYMEFFGTFLILGLSFFRNEKMIKGGEF